jgi:signal peptidase I
MAVRKQLIIYFQTKLMKNKNNDKKRSSWRFVKNLLITLSIALIFRIFLFEVYLVPSSSMVSTILPGEVLIVNKSIYGARLGIEPESGKETRVHGLSHIKHNDVVVFNFPEADTIYRNRPDLNFYDYAGWQSYGKAVHDTIEHGPLTYQPVKYRQPFVKRCIGMPGDTIRIFKNAVFVNDKCVKDMVGFWKSVIDTVPGASLYYLEKTLSPPQKPKEKYHYFFPHHIAEKWDNEYYGPLYIPRKGDVVHIDMDNISHFSRIITAYEHNQLDTLQGRIYINGIVQGTYTFQQNYYYMMGDNHFGSIDSRFWGFVPEDHIIGKAVAIIWSREKERPGWFKVRDNRLLRRIK